MYTNPAASSLRHKCYDPGEPNNHTTVQFLIMLQWSYHQMYYSPFKKQEDSTSEKKVPQDIIITIIISVDIYIHMYIYIHPITEIHASLLKKQHVFPQSNTHIRTLSPGAYLYTIVFCCVCFFSIQKKIKMLTYKSQLFNNSHQCNIQTKKKENKKTSSLRQAMHISFVAWYQSIPWCMWIYRFSYSWLFQV